MSGVPGCCCGCCCGGGAGAACCWGVVACWALADCCLSPPPNRLPNSPPPPARGATVNVKVCRGCWALLLGSWCLDTACRCCANIVLLVAVAECVKKQQRLTLALTISRSDQFLVRGLRNSFCVVCHPRHTQTTTYTTQPTVISQHIGLSGLGSPTRSPTHPTHEKCSSSSAHYQPNQRLVQLGMWWCSAGAAL